MKYNSLIHGKNHTENIVSIEVVDPYIELYIQNTDGSIRTEYIDNKYWMLTDKPIRDFVKLKGDLHYKYGRQFTDRDEFTRMRAVYNKNNDMFSIWNPQEACMVKDGYTLFKGMKTGDVSVLAFDIETTGTQLDIYSKVLIIANTFRDHTGKITRKLFTYDSYASVSAMLSDWCDWVRKMNPTIICGHNLNTFDIPYLQHVAEMEGIDLVLGRDGSILTTERRESKFRRDGSQFIAYKRHKIFGRHIIDTFFLSIKYDVGRKYDNYKLKYIIEFEGLEAKDRQFYDASLIRKNYTVSEEWEKIKKYAEFDGDDALKLYDLMSPAQFYWTQKVPKTYQMITEGATGSQINAMMIRSYLQNMHSLPKASESVPFVGALSGGIPGIHNNVLKWDISSLYPSIILQYEVYDRHKDPEGNFLKIVKILREERLKNKKLAKDTGNKVYSDIEQSEKIGINSSYGTLGAPGLLFNSPRNAEFITKKGQEILKKAVTWATGLNL